MHRIKGTDLLPGQGREADAAVAKGLRFGVEELTSVI